MNIAVCVKQVPAADDVRMNREGNLQREGYAAKLNPYDLPAVEAALQVAQTCGGTVTAITMGPPGAKEAVMTCLAMGVDRGILMTDAAFAGADTYATSRTLAKGLQATGPYDLILCGRQTTDGDTGQVGPQIGEHLAIPHVYSAIAVERVEAAAAVVVQRIGNSALRLQVSLPCVLIVAKDAYVPRLPTLKGKLEAKKKTVRVLSVDDLNESDPNRFGLSGSPTRVERIFLPERPKQETVLTADDDTIVALLADRLAALKIMEGRK